MTPHWFIGRVLFLIGLAVLMFDIFMIYFGIAQTVRKDDALWLGVTLTGLVCGFVTVGMLVSIRRDLIRLYGRM